MQGIINVWKGLPKATMKHATVSIFKDKPDKEEKNSMIQTLDRQVDALPWDVFISKFTNGKETFSEFFSWGIGEPALELRFFQMFSHMP